jgi:hypothetical protein
MLTRRVRIQDTWAMHRCTRACIRVQCQNCILVSGRNEILARGTVADGPFVVPATVRVTQCMLKLTKTLFGFFMVLETSLRSPRVHLFYNPTLAGWRSHHARPDRRASPSRILSSTLLKTQHGGFPTLRAHDKSRTTNESGALHDHLDLPQTIADYVRSACPKASRFPMTLATPLVTSAAPASARPSSAQVAGSRADDVFVNRQKLREVFPLINEF